MILPEKISKTIRRPTGISSWKVWLNKDVSLRGISKGKKLKISQQVKVIQLFKQLLKAGFTLTEIVAKIQRDVDDRPITREHHQSGLRKATLANVLTNAHAAEHGESALEIEWRKRRCAGDLFHAERFREMVFDVADGCADAFTPGHGFSSFCSHCRQKAGRLPDL